MSKNSIFFGQPIYGQLIKSLDRDKIVEISRKYGGERYVKSFDGFTHLATTLYAVIMKKSLRYEVLVDCMSQNPKGETEHREQVVVFRKDGINHIARIVTYVDIKKGKEPKLVSLLTNDFDMSADTIVAIYRRRWQVESLFKQIKQNFPLRYFYGESANAIKIQIWVTLIANLLLSVLQCSLQRSWSFSGLATIVRITLMYYINMEKLFNNPYKDLEKMLAESLESPPENVENLQGGAYPCSG